MELKIPYGKKNQSIHLPDKNLLAVLEPSKSQKDANQVLREGFFHPIGGESFADFISNQDREKFLFIVNDGTRATPTEDILDYVVPLCQAAKKKVEFLVATGSHRAPNEKEYKMIFGEYYNSYKENIFYHDAKDSSQLFSFMKTSWDNEIYLNKKVNSADSIVIIGSVEPHYFAGYTGGRKAFLPGIAGYDSIKENHRKALSPEAGSLQLENNPVHLEFEEVLNAIGIPIFSIMTVLDSKHQIFGCLTGDIKETFKGCIPLAKEVFVKEVPSKADIAITVSPYPMDVDLYQSQKAIDNVKGVLKENAIIILVSTCWDGIGPENFFQMLKKYAFSPSKGLAEIEKNFKLGYHKTAKLLQVYQHNQIWAVTELNSADLEKANILFFNTVQEALDQALEIKGSNAQVLVSLDGPLVIPEIK